MSQLEPVAGNKRRFRDEGRSPGLIIAEVGTMLLFLLFMVPCTSFKDSARSLPPVVLVFAAICRLLPVCPPAR